MPELKTGLPLPDYAYQLIAARTKLAELMAAVAELKLLVADFEDVIRVRKVRTAELQIKKSRRGIRGRRKRVVAA